MIDKLVLAIYIATFLVFTFVSTCIHSTHNEEMDVRYLNTLEINEKLLECIKLTNGRIDHYHMEDK